MPLPCLVSALVWTDSGAIQEHQATAMAPMNRLQSIACSLAARTCLAFPRANFGSSPASSLHRSCPLGMLLGLALTPSKCLQPHLQIPSASFSKGSSRPHCSSSSSSSCLYSDMMLHAPMKLFIPLPDHRQHLAIMAFLVSPAMVRQSIVH